MGELGALMPASCGSCPLVSLSSLEGHKTFIFLSDIDETPKTISVHGGREFLVTLV